MERTKPEQISRRAGAIGNSYAGHNVSSLLKVLELFLSWAET